MDIDVQELESSKNKIIEDAMKEYGQDYFDWVELISQEADENQIANEEFKVETSTKGTSYAE